MELAPRFFKVSWGDSQDGTAFGSLASVKLAAMAADCAKERDTKYQDELLALTLFASGASWALLRQVLANLRLQTLIIMGQLIIYTPKLWCVTLQGGKVLDPKVRRQVMMPYPRHVNWKKRMRVRPWWFSEWQK